MSAHPSTRRQCLDLLTDIVGYDGVGHWLRLRQPCFEDRTGAWMLNSDPERLLRHLQALAADLYDDGLDDLPVVVDRPPARRSEREAAKVLGILDELREDGRRA